LAPLRNEGAAVEIDKGENRKFFLKTDSVRNLQIRPKKHRFMEETVEITVYVRRVNVLSPQTRFCNAEVLYPRVSRDS
jgi:hypothetical protein